MTLIVRKRPEGGQELPGTEGAARAEPSLLELCRVASEEDEVNIQEFARNVSF